MKKQLLVLTSIVFTSSLIGCSTPEDRACDPLEKKFISLWEKGNELNEKSKRLQNSLTSYDEAARWAATPGGAEILSKKLQQEIDALNSLTKQTQEITAELQSIPEKWAASSCSLERWSKFQGRHPEIWP